MSCVVWGQTNETIDELREKLTELRRTGKYSEASRIAERMLELVQQEFGAEHPSVGEALNSLAEFYQKQGRYLDAEPLYKRSLAIREKTLGPDHLDVADTLNDLAVLYRSQGRYSEAEPLYRRSLEIAEKRLGPLHPDVATILNNIARLYEAQGRYLEAEALYRRALEAKENGLGAEHPEVAEALNNLGSLLRDEGRYNDVESLYRRSLAIRERTFGVDHPDVGQSLNNLAGLYREQGRYGDAESLYKRSLAITEKALGSEHPSVATSLSQLAEVYREQRRYGEAEPLQRRALAIREKALGAAHPDLGLSLTRLGLLYLEMGENTSAETCINRALRIRQAALGEKHPDVGMSQAVLASIYEKQNRRGEAEKLYRRALEIQEGALGTNHPAVATTRANLGALLKSDGRLEEAFPLLQSALTIRERTLPQDHPAVAISLIQLAELYRLQGRDDDSRKLFKRAFELKRSGIKVLPILFATDRKQNAVEKAITFGNDRAFGGQVTIGAAKITIPKEVGGARKTSAKHDQNELDESTDVRRLAIQPLEIHENQRFVEIAREALQGAELYKMQSVIFVHGYNVSFENALRRAGQIAYDINFDGPTFLFSWPSRGRLLGYISDRDAVDVAANHLKQFLERTVAVTKTAKVHIIAHSMGNMVVLRALEKMSVGSIASSLVLGEIIAAAPDVSIEQFSGFVEESKGRGANITLYASATDWPLWLSGKLSRQRAGYIDGRPIPIKGADTIDITGAGMGVFALNHDVYAANPVIVGDMRGILRGDRPPERRTKEFRRFDDAEGTYWKFEPRIEH